MSARDGTRDLVAVRRTAGVPVLRQLGHLATLRSANGTGRAEYFRYRMWRSELGVVDRFCYTSQRERRQTEAATNRRELIAHGGGKSALADRLSSVGVPGPELLGRIGSHAEASVRTETALAELLSREGHAALVIKPERGMQGEGIMVITAADAQGAALLSGQTYSVASLWRQLQPRIDSGWRVERWVVPHPVVASWRPGATPTVRILTLFTGGQAVVHAASVKVPVGASGVDNLAQGNLAATVDLETGVVGLATDGTGIPWHRRHPESGAPIAGITIPGWSAFLAVALHGAGLLLPRRAIGWDVAVGASGPVLIEANSRWCEKLIQLPAGRGVTRGPFIRLLHEMNAGGLLARRRLVSREWRQFERRALEGEG